MKAYFVLSFIETHIYIPKVEKCSELGMLRGSLFLSISSKRQYMWSLNTSLSHKTAIL